jgi:hypothetical protein
MKKVLTSEQLEERIDFLELALQVIGDHPHRPAAEAELKALCANASTRISRAAAREERAIRARLASRRK